MATALPVQPTDASCVQICNFSLIIFQVILPYCNEPVIGSIHLLWASYKELDFKKKKQLSPASCTEA